VLEQTDLTLIIDYKWEEHYPFMFAVLSYYLVFVFFTSIHIIWYLSEPNYPLIWIIWILCLGGISYEGFQMYTSGLEDYFFSQIWNYFDLGSFFGTILYCSFMLSEGGF